MKVDTHLGDKEVNTNAFLETEVVEEELTDAKTKVIQNGFKQNLYSRRSGEREDGV